MLVYPSVVDCVQILKRYYAGEAIRGESRLPYDKAEVGRFIFPLRLTKTENV